MRWPFPRHRKSRAGMPAESASMGQERQRDEHSSISARILSPSPASRPSKCEYIYIYICIYIYIYILIYLYITNKWFSSCWCTYPRESSTPNIGCHTIKLERPAPIEILKAGSETLKLSMPLHRKLKFVLHGRHAAWKAISNHNTIAGNPAGTHNTAPTSHLGGWPALTGYFSCRSSGSWCPCTAARLP